MQKYEICVFKLSLHFPLFAISVARPKLISSAKKKTPTEFKTDKITQLNNNEHKNHIGLPPPYT